MKENWRYDELFIKIFFLIMIAWGWYIFVYKLFNLPEMECSKLNDTCNIYSINVINKTKKLVDKFNISDISDPSDISPIIMCDARHHKNGLPGCDISIYIKTRRNYINLPFIVINKSRAEDIFYNILNKDEFVIKTKILYLFNYLSLMNSQ